VFRDAFFFSASTSMRSKLLPRQRSLQPCNSQHHCAQALQALADHPTGTQTIPHLVHLASRLSEEHDTSHWLGSDLVPTVLSVLRSLTTTQPPLHATRVCAAAVAAINNVFRGLDHPDLCRQLHATLTSDDRACRALVHWGISCPTSSKQLPRDQTVFVPRGADVALLPDNVTTRDHPFWSPLTCCVSFLCAIAADPSIPAEQRLPRAIQGAINPDLMERVMSVGIQHPCGGAPACPPGFALPRAGFALPSVVGHR
jgi:hypothetical protein